MEGVGAHDGTFQRRAGHRAQLRETGETPEGRALGTPERPRSFSLQRSQKPAFSPRGGSCQSSGNARPSPHQADAAQAGIQRRREGLVVGKDPPHVGAACGERGSGGPRAAQNAGIPGAPSPAEQSGQHCPGMRMGQGQVSTQSVRWQLTEPSACRREHPDRHLGIPKPAGFGGFGARQATGILRAGMGQEPCAGAGVGKRE